MQMYSLNNILQTKKRGEVEHCMLTKGFKKMNDSLPTQDINI